VGAGQTIVYTVRYRNAGEETQHGVKLMLTGDGVDSASNELDLGDVGPGEEVQRTFQWIVPEDFQGAWAAVKGLLYDTAHPAGEALDWLSMTHPVDQVGPGPVRITRPSSTVGPVRAAVEGVAYDESGVNSVELEIAGPGGTRAIPCSVPRAAEGRWQCDWNVGGADGDQFTLRAHAVDVYGHDNWSDPRTVQVDARPPELRLTTPLTATVRGGALLLGSALDDSGITVVRVCVDDKCGRASLLGAEGSATRWAYPLPGAPADYVPRTLAVEAMDRVGNWTQTLKVDFTQDNVAPALTASQDDVQVPRGQKQTVLRGDVQDGGPDPRVFVLVRRPDGSRSWKNTARGGDQWWYELSGDMPGRYTLWLHAIDRTGNTRTMGPYAVDVTCTDAALEAALTAERLGASSAYTLTAVVTNTGPALLPAGAPVTLYVGETPLGPAQLLPELAQGQSSAVTAQWTRPGPAGYEFSAVVNEPPGEVLCARPPRGHAWIRPDVDLRISKTVQPAAAAPGDVITYTLEYTNAGAGLATGVVISDPLPLELLAPAYQSTGAAITPVLGSAAFAWQVADLASGLGGQIVISGTVDPAVTTPITLTNTVTITAPLEGAPVDNVARVELPVELAGALTATPASQAVQCGDVITPVTFLYTDLAGEAPAVSVEWRGPDGSAASGLPPGAVLETGACEPATGGQTCGSQLSGRAEVPAGIYTVTLTVTNTQGAPRTAQTVLDVAAEDAELQLDPGNPVVVPASETGLNPGFELQTLAREATPRPKCW
jgi:uncharacterized repeat protein (TIGR01451 family)